MKPTRLSLIVCMFLSVCLLHSRADNGALFKATFLAGEWQPYVLLSTDYALDGTDTVSYQRLSAKTDVFVSDSTASHYLLTWRFHGFSIETDSRLLKAAVAKAAPVTVTCLVSPVGVLREFLDWSSVTTCLDEALRSEVPAYAQRRDTAAKLELERLYALRSSLESFFLRGIRCFHQLHGYGYDLGVAVDVPTMLALPGVGEPVPGTVRKRLDSVDEAGTAIVSTVSWPNPTHLRTLLAHAKGLTDQTVAVPDLKMSGATIFDLKTGWVFYTFEALEQTTDKLVAGQLLELTHSSTNHSIQYEHDH